MVLMACYRLKFFIYPVIAMLASIQNEVMNTSMMQTTYVLFRTLIFAFLLSLLLINNLFSGLTDSSEHGQKQRLTTADYAIGSTARNLTTLALQNKAGSHAATRRTQRRVISSQPNHDTPTKQPVLPQAKKVYQCEGENGQNVFSDRPCDNLKKVIPIAHFKPNLVNAYQSASKQAISTNKPERSSSYQRKLADSNEINKRYDNLRTVIKHLLGNNHNMLNQLSSDRNNALSMYAKRGQTYSINQHYDNLIRDIRRKQSKTNSHSIARQLLRIERQRNKELYD